MRDRDLILKNQREVGSSRYKLVCLGDISVGKTSIINNFLFRNYNTKYQPTIAVDFWMESVYIKDKKIRFDIWDTAGQERFRCLIPSYLRDSSVALIVYDVTNRQSFLNTTHWLEQVRKVRGTDVIVVLVGNKSDLVEKRNVSIEEGNAKARELGVMFIESSADSGFNIEPLFRKVAAHLVGMETLSSTKQEDTVVELKSSSNTSQSDQQARGCSC